MILINHGNERVRFERGDRIAQMVIARYEKAEWEEVDSLEETDRKGGFGHTGIS